MAATFVAATSVIPVRARPGDQEHDPRDPTFKTGVELVTLAVTVERADGVFEPDLTRDDFQVLEDGVSQDILLFGDGTVPVDLVLMLDTSASMTARLATAQRAAVNFLDTLQPQDRAAVLAVGGRTAVLQSLTADRGALRAAIARASAGGSTRLYDALYVALKEFATPDGAEFRRRALVVLTDGEDTASLLPFESVLDLARRTNVAVYPISVDPYLDRDARRFTSTAYNLRLLARETGARSFFPRNLGEMQGVYGSITQELAHQYALAYTPRDPGAPGDFRRVAVIVDCAGTRVRTRAGYLVGDD